MRKAEAPQNGVCVAFSVFLKRSQVARSLLCGTEDGKRQEEHKRREMEGVTEETVLRDFRLSKRSRTFYIVCSKIMPTRKANKGTKLILKGVSVD